MIKALVSVVMALIALICIVIFATVLLFALAMFDYALNTDIYRKIQNYVEQHNNLCSPLKRLHEKTMKVVEKLDTPTLEDLYVAESLTNEEAKSPLVKDPAEAALSGINDIPKEEPKTEIQTMEYTKQVEKETEDDFKDFYEV